MDSPDEYSELNQTQLGSPAPLKPKRWNRGRILALTLLLLLIIAGLAVASTFFLLGTALSIYIAAPLAFVVLIVGLYLAYRSSSVSWSHYSNLLDSSSESTRNSSQFDTKKVNPPLKLSDTLKIALFGDAQAGKTAFLERYANNPFIENYISTIGVEIKTKQLEKTSEWSKPPKLEILDTAGLERFQYITDSYIKSNGIMVMYDITSKESFEKAKTEIDRIKKHSNFSEGTKMMLVGCKSDLTDKRQVSTQEARQYAQEQGLLFTETSAKTGDGVKAAFETLVHEITNQYQASSDLSATM